MTPSLAAAYDALVERASALPAVGRVRAAFEATAGAFSPEDPFYEERAAALWCRVLVDPEVAAILGGDPTLGAAARCLGRAQRGLFAVRGEGADVDLDCLASGASFRLSRADSAHAGLRETASEGERLDGYVAPSPEGIALLPGVLVHAAAARSALEQVVRDHTLSTSELLDRLLGMRHRLATLGRMRPEMVYRWR